MDDKEPNANRVTVLAKEFTPTAMEFHKNKMGEKGYRLEGKIVPAVFQLIDSPGKAKDLFDGDEYYAVTFVKK